MAKRCYNAAYRWEEFNERDLVWLHLRLAYRPKGKPNKRETLHRQGPYSIIRKVSLLAYELDIPSGTKIHPIISVVYLSRYRSYKDPFQRVPPPLGPVEYDNSGFKASTDGEWKLERIVDHRTKRSGIEYLVRWKGFGPQYDVWMKQNELKYARQLQEEYHERRQCSEELKDRWKERRCRIAAEE